MKTIYVCGPTVYAEPHIGNIRPILTFDLFIRALRFNGEEVMFIHNITDIDDKIIAKAKKENTTEKIIADRYKEQYFVLLEKLNIVSPDHKPEVVENIDLIINFIKDLVALNKAYVLDGDVYFDISAMPRYGEISHQNVSEMKYEQGGAKKHPADFALWKSTSEGIKFTSPWGEGRPGWHTECAAFINKYLNGEPLDIHGGGIDLLFPHHENENIQYLALNNKPIANEWRHVGHLNVDNQKMSKSIGNTITADEFLKTYNIDTLRYIFLSTNYSMPVDITEDMIKQASEILERFEKAFIKSQLFDIDQESKGNVIAKQVADKIVLWKFSDAMKIINETIKQFNKTPDLDLAQAVFSIFQLLGFNFNKRILTSDQKALYNLWEKIRDAKDFEQADKIRQVLIELKLV